MSVQPLPDNVDLDDIESTNYTLVPYALQFPDEDQALPVASFVANTEARTIEAYLLAANGSWSKLDTMTVDEESTILTHTGESIYQSLVGVTGPSWEEFHKLRDKLDEFVSVTPDLDSELVNLAEKSESDNADVFCTCSDPELYIDSYVETETIDIDVSICTSCDKLYKINGDFDELNTTLTSLGDMSISNIVDQLDPSKITNTSHDDQYLYTTPSYEPTPITEVGIAIWWMSQQRNHRSTQYMPTESNFTAFIKGDQIIGGAIWTYLLGSIPLISHIHLFDPDNLSSKDVQEYITTWEQEVGELFIEQPYNPQHIFRDAFTPAIYASGSIQFETKPS